MNQTVGAPVSDPARFKVRVTNAPDRRSALRFMESFNLQPWTCIGAEEAKPQPKRSATGPPVAAVPDAEGCPVERGVLIRAEPLRAGTARAPAVPQIRRHQRTISTIAARNLRSGAPVCDRLCEWPCRESRSQTGAPVGAGKVAGVCRWNSSTSEEFAP